jgi:hypothetical protein
MVAKLDRFIKKRVIKNIFFLLNALALQPFVIRTGYQMVKIKYKASCVGQYNTQ